jgi:hypothetical protein
MGEGRTGLAVGTLKRSDAPTFEALGLTTDAAVRWCTYAHPCWRVHLREQRARICALHLPAGTPADQLVEIRGTPFQGVFNLGGVSASSPEVPLIDGHLPHASQAADVVGAPSYDPSCDIPWARR